MNTKKTLNTCKKCHNAAVPEKGMICGRCAAKEESKLNKLLHKMRFHLR